MAGYGQFCPVAKAMEVLDERWTILIVRELLLGSRHFNEIRRGVPRMSPALLTKRLRGLERAGVLTRDEAGAWIRNFPFLRHSRIQVYPQKLRFVSPSAFFVNSTQAKIVF